MNAETTATGNKIASFEIYTSNPETGEQGWNIEFVDILVENVSENDIKAGRIEARQLLKKHVPNFDEIIIFDRFYDTTETSEAFTDGIYRITSNPYNA